MRGKWWLALLAVVGFPIGMAALTQFFEKRYTAGMRILVDTTVKGYDQGNATFSNIDDILGFSRARSTETHINIMTGTEVLQRAIELSGQRFPNAFAGPKINEHYESLIRRLGVESSPMSDVITLRVTMDNPEVAAEVANNIGNAYIDFTRRMENESGEAGLALVKNQLKIAQTRLDSVDKDIAAAKNEAKISDPSVASQSTTTFVAGLESRTNDLKAAYEGAKAELSSAEASLRGMPKMIDTSTTEAYNPALQDIEVNLGRAEAELKAAQVRYHDDHPTVQEYTKRIAQYKAQLKSLKRGIEAQSVKSYSQAYLNQETVVANARGRVASLENQLRESESALGEAQQRVTMLPEVERKLANLTRQRTVLESTFLQLEQRRETLESTKTGRKSVARIVSSALPPVAPSFPDVRLFTLIGLAIGVIVGALIIMPKGDQDIYGQWNQRNRPLRPRQNRGAGPLDDTDRPAMPPGDI